MSISKTATTSAARDAQIHEAKSVTLDIAIETDSVVEEHKVRAEFGEPSIKSRFAKNLAKAGINPKEVEESVGGKFVKVAGAGIALGVKVASIVFILIFIVGAIKLKQIQSGAQSYQSIPEGTL